MRYSFRFFFPAVLLLFSAVVSAGEGGGQDKSNARRKFLKSDVDLANLAVSVQQPVQIPTLMQIDIYDTVAYVGDVAYEKLISSPVLKNSAPKLATNVTAMGDIRKINDKGARGLYVNVAFPIFTTPTPSPETGFSIADITRIAAVGQCFDIYTAEGKPIGSIFAWGFAFGEASPGAPRGVGGGAIAITGGTGPWVGIRGQMNTTWDTTPFGADPSVRFASAEESSALRRVNKGGVTKFLLELYPAASPDAVLLEDGVPAVFHASDQSLVTRTNPAAPGEILTALVRNLGPTNPGVNNGTPFPRTPVTEVNSPVEVRVGDTAADVTFAGGEPGAIGVYDLEFRVPKTAPSGRASVRVYVGYVGGVTFPIYVE